ncbi:hypothetical protein L6R53_17195 [Myxococcota bacterium]|nr:hypothetical protein [Myxococcota bacterium]
MRPPPPPRLLLTLLLIACGPEEPVLQGVPAEPMLAGQPAAADLAGGTASDPTRPYARREGVVVDVHYLGGRSYTEHRDALADQLGALREVVDLPAGAGQRLDFERGTAQVLDDRIYMLRVPLPEPMRRSQALEVLGFPPYVGRYVTLHREYRLNNAWEFRRIRLRRASAEDELVTEVEAWHHVPGEVVP